MVAAEAVPEDAWITQVNTVDGDVSAWSNVSSSMTALTDSLDTLRSFELWNTMAVATSDSTKLAATSTTSAIAGTYNMSISQLAQAESVRSMAFTSATADLSSEAGGTGVLTEGDQFQIGGVTFTIGKNEYGQTDSGGAESLTSLAAKINYASSSMTAGEQVAASVVSASPTENYLVLSAANTGSAGIDSADTTGSALQKLKILSSPGTGNNYTKVLIQGQDAKLSLDGISMSRSSNSGITDVINGVSLNLLAPTTSVGTNGGTTDSPVTLTVSPDMNGVMTAIQTFISAYNAAASEITTEGAVTLQTSTGNGATSTGTVSSTGQLYDDSLLTQLSVDIREQATASKFPALNKTNASYSYNGQTGIMCSLQDIGIGTTGESNQLSIIDQNKLDNGLQNYFNKVEQLFTGTYNPQNGYQNGVASDFYNYAYGMSEPQAGEIAQHVQTLNNQKSDLQTEISNWNDYLNVYTTNLWSQFTTMDNAMTTMQSSLSTLQGITGLTT